MTQMQDPQKSPQVQDSPTTPASFWTLLWAGFFLVTAFVFLSLGGATLGLGWGGDPAPLDFIFHGYVFKAWVCLAIALTMRNEASRWLFGPLDRK